MTAQILPLPKEQGLSIVAAAVRDGEYRCATPNEVIAACKAMAQRYLTRDAKDGNLFRPGVNAIDMLDRARALGKLPEADAASLPERKVATVVIRRLSMLETGCAIWMKAPFWR